MCLQSRKAPNFLIIGAMKSGTTSLYNYLGQHPQVYMSPNKEPRFFVYENRMPDSNIPQWLLKTFQETTVTTLEEYESLFNGITTETVAGEASPIYLYVPRAIESIKKHVPCAKFIAILRNPIERAYSSYMHLQNHCPGVEPYSFEEALALEKKRIAENTGYLWRYTDIGFYGEQLDRYYDSFPRSQIRVCLYEDMVRDSAGLTKELFTFLDVDPEFTVDTGERHNVSGIPRHLGVHRLLKGDGLAKHIARNLVPEQIRSRVARMLKRANLRRPAIEKDTYNRLVDIFSDDVKHLQGLIDRDLGSWLEYR